MAESFLRLSRSERLEALGVAATASGRPAYLLEKDIWVVWALQRLFESKIGEHLVFKGGTSLSKGYDIIERFSEDIDLTYDVVDRLSRRLVFEILDKGIHCHIIDGLRFSVSERVSAFVDFFQ